MITVEQAGKLALGHRIWTLNKEAHYRWPNIHTVRRIQLYKRTPRVKVFLRGEGFIIIERGVDNWHFVYNPYRAPVPMGSPLSRG